MLNLILYVQQFQSRNMCMEGRTDEHTPLQYALISCVFFKERIPIGVSCERLQCKNDEAILCSCAKTTPVAQHSSVLRSNSGGLAPCGKAARQEMRQRPGD